MEGFNSKCGHLEEKVNTGPLEQNQQFKDWMLKEVMLSFTMRVRLIEIFFLDGIDANINYSQAQVAGSLISNFISPDSAVFW